MGTLAKVDIDNIDRLLDRVEEAPAGLSQLAHREQMSQSGGLRLNDERRVLVTD